ASSRPAHGARGVPRRRPASASRGERAWPRRRERHRDQRRGRLREARARRVRRRRMVGRRRRQHERDRRERRGRPLPRAPAVRRRARDRPRRSQARAVMRAQAAVPLGRGRFTELALLIWVATIAITGFVAVLAAETAAFRPAAVGGPRGLAALVLSVLACPGATT